jgi:L-lactate dehydrogenase complex protein LldG
MSAREAILSRLRAAPTRAVEAPSLPIPARAQQGRQALWPAFVEELERVAGTAERVPAAQVPAAVARYLDGLGLPARGLRSADLGGYDWAGAGLDLAEGSPGPDTALTVVSGHAAIAETGSVLVSCGPGRVNSLFMATDTLVLLVPASGLAGSYEEAFAALPRPFARATTLITGPSRTADIEQTLTLGAHGAVRLHVVLAE